jgi:Tfp pilus assembly protein PilX
VRKIAVKMLIRDEKGQVLILALLVLLLVGLISGPLLSYMVSGLRAGHLFESGAAELYAADAGVEDAVWRIPNAGLCPGSPTTHYTIPDVNGNSVEVTITYVNNLTYQVESVATGDGSATKIDAYIIGNSIYGDYSGITNNVITSQHEIILKPGTEVNPSTGNHSPAANYTKDWPTAAELCDWYREDTEDATHYYSDTTIDLNGVSQPLDALCVDGNLTIKNSSNTPATLTLTGTIYATGDTLIGATGKDFTIDLNGQAIFVASNSTDPKKALWLGAHCTLVGEGVIIAIGDIYFEPKTEAGVTDPVFIMSVVGLSHVQPGGDFYGSIAGSVEVDLWPGTSLNYPETGFGVLNFPGCTAGRFVYSIVSWEVSRL